MFVLEPIYLRLGAFVDKSVDQALAAALPTAGPQASTLIVQTLISRASDEGRLALVRSFDQLAPPLRDMVVAQGESLYRALSIVASQRHTTGPANVIEIVRRARQPRLADLAADLLRHGEADLWPAAADALLELSRWAAPLNPPEQVPSGKRGPSLALPANQAPLNPPEQVPSGKRSPSLALPANQAPLNPPEQVPRGKRGPSLARPANQASINPTEQIPCDGPAAAHLQAAIEDALSTFRHHAQTGVLLALANLAPRAMPAVVTALSDREHPAVAPLRCLLAEAGTPEIRRCLLAFARIPTFATAVLDGLTIAAPVYLGEVLAASHLLLGGPVARAIARMPDPQHVLPAAPHDSTIPAGLAAALPAWIQALPLDPAQRLTAWSSMALSPHAPARLRALRCLLALDPAEQPQALDAVAAFCGDADSHIARIALRHLVRTHWAGLTRRLLQLVNSPHAEVRKLAGDYLAPLGFKRFWDAWPNLNLAHQLAGGRALIKLSPNFHRLVGDKLGSHDRPSVLRALAIIHTLNQGGFFEPALIALLRSPDQVIAATAVRALGSGQTPEAVRALEAALQHGDGRVRANAVESLEQLRSTRHVEQLLEMAQEDESRPRANAIHALMAMRAGDAMGALSRMLDDPRSRQRTSALWLVDQLGVVEVARHVAEMSISDPDAQVKTRASGVIHHLIEAMREGTGEGTAKAG